MFGHLCRVVVVFPCVSLCFFVLICLSPPSLGKRDRSCPWRPAYHVFSVGVFVVLAVSKEARRNPGQASAFGSWDEPSMLCTWIRASPQEPPSFCKPVIFRLFSVWWVSRLVNCYPGWLIVLLGSVCFSRLPYWVCLLTVIHHISGVALRIWHVKSICWVPIGMTER